MEFSQLFDLPYLPFTAMIFVGVLIFAIEVVLSFTGIGIETDGDGLGDFGASDFSFRFFSLMTVASFTMVGGSFGLYTLIKSDSLILAVLVALVAGLGISFIVYKLKKNLMKIQSNGMVDYSKAVGNIARVYLSIKDGKMGQVEVDFQGRRKYVDAVAQEHEQEFASGSLVKVVGVKDKNILVVAKAD